MKCTGLCFLTLRGAERPDLIVSISFAIIDSISGGICRLFSFRIYFDIIKNSCGIKTAYTYFL